MQLLASDTDAVSQAGLDIHVHVFQAHRPLESARLDIRPDLVEALDNAVALVLGQHPHLGQHGGMGDGAGDVVVIEALVEVHRGGEALDEGIGGLAEPTAPGLL